ncbi:MAG: putative outer membrane protein [Sphingomonas bacterium]|uniref:right-handed parallel beta-helix repeat-containing protein n=1 Tax=Sphingomonas bacterium TaxID=1895847 RepID=UPI0026219368|nr:right-handed parallel beta-helix repeat-containing protein [Sphingomonas bacterium]MDB5711818.1 putative outer membrane protein [Sphingomonas bacterium]
MSKLIRILGVAMTALLCSLCLAAPASAQATRTWISGVGDDVNPCSRTAPCKTWAGAISKTAAGGEIDCLDPGGFGSVTIVKSITLDCSEGSGGAGGILNSGVPGVIINDPNGATTPTIKVHLRNLTINGAGTTVGTYAVRFLSGKSLTMQNVNISNQGTGGVPAVSFEPSAASVGALLLMTDVHIKSVSGPGVDIKPNGNVSVSAVLDHVTISDSQPGVTAEDGATVTIANSNISGNTGRGVYAVSNSGTVTAVVNILHTTIASNGNFGVAAAAGTTIRLSDVSIFNNALGGIKAVGTVLSFKNNNLGPDAGNSGLPNATVVLQ